MANGKTVFVDVTADWCITCKVNRALVLDTDEIRVWLKQKNIVQMRADWTSPNPIIAAFLQGFMRYGIPFNVAFGPKAVDGIILPELLIESSNVPLILLKLGTHFLLPCLLINKRRLLKFSNRLFLL